MNVPELLMLRFWGFFCFCFCFLNASSCGWHGTVVGQGSVRTHSGHHLHLCKLDYAFCQQPIKDLLKNLPWKKPFNIKQAQDLSLQNGWELMRRKCLVPLWWHDSSKAVLNTLSEAERGNGVGGGTTLLHKGLKDSAEWDCLRPLRSVLTNSFNFSLLTKSVGINLFKPK